MEKLYVMQTPVMFKESYIRDFVTKALEGGYIPSEEEFEYCEKGNLAAVENTLLMALSFTAALNTSHHKALLAMCEDRIRDTFKLFAEHGVVLSIFRDKFTDNA